MKNTAEILRSKGLKVTPQRIAIFNMMIMTKKHPNAETIYKTLEPSHPTMSLATVYKTLDFFKGIGLIQELNVGEGSSRYDARPESHPHVVCTQCKSVADLAIDGLSDLRGQIAHLTNYHLETEQIIFYGTCPECLKEKAIVS